MDFENGRTRRVAHQILACCRRWSAIVPLALSLAPVQRTYLSDLGVAMMEKLDELSNETRLAGCLPCQTRVRDKRLPPPAP